MIYFKYTWGAGCNQGFHYQFKFNEKEIIHMNDEDICVCCGGYVPEGRMVCLKCENKYLGDS